MVISSRLDIVTMNMDKFCVFCGKKPQSKNREHIIPQWLIALTGDPNRDVYLGRKWASGNLEERRFSFKAFTLPACRDCNNSFSHLEDQVKPVVEAILCRAAVAEKQWDIFLDWLDKIRTGLWLAMIYLNENYRGLKPMFHITRRVGAKDRFVIVYEIVNDGDKGVGWAMTDSPLFHYMPSCFTMTINNFVFFNASCDFLLAFRFGFPYPTRVDFCSEGGQWVKLEKGTERLKFPLIERKFKTGGMQLFQPMIPYNQAFEEDGSPANLLDFYDTEYVRSNCLDFDSGRGHIFRREGNDLVRYSQTASTEWFPKQRFPRGELAHQTGMIAGQFLEQIYHDHQPSFDSLSSDDRKEREAEVGGAIRLHRKIMEHYLGQKDMYY